MLPSFGLYDFFLLIIYLFVIYLVAILFVQNRVKTDTTYRFFIKALTLKIVGGLIYAFYHVYVYKGGDTFVFYNAAKDLVHFTSFFEPNTFLVYFSDFDPVNFDFSPRFSYILGSHDVLFMVKLTSFIYYLGAGSYYAMTLVFSILSFLGLWSLFKIFSRLYPTVQKELLLAIFALPTMVLWSSGVLKDTVTIGALGGVVYGVANIFVFNKKRLLSVVFIVIGILLIFKLKPYLIYLLIPSILLWIQANIKSKIRSRFIRNLVTPILIVGIIISLSYILVSLSSSAGKYSLDNWQSTLKGFHSWHSYLSETSHQSGYSLGEMDYTLWGVLQKLPAALNVTFFRPYFWEVRNIPTLLGGIEGAIFLIMTLYILMKLRFRFFILIFKNKDLTFLVSFALSFGFIVGLSSYNFGALSRYKIPAELFYLIGLAILYSYIKHDRVKSN